ncbi:protein lifeguard 1 [Chanos chanos]|uniref:Protein lifeguard 1 n=1 Tax=Chanos chanos TaxID=29144 RepID=A0A6J2VEX0_CHACN|nr:protein lifeguard 1-like [Chanos chanos]
MTDIQSQPPPEEKQGEASSDMSTLQANPTSEVQMEHPPPYMPPPYPPYYSPSPAVYPPPAPYQGGCIGINLPPEETGCPTISNPTPQTGYESVDESSTLVVSSFDDKTIRKAFIRKVFSVVTLQLLVTFSVVCIFTFSSALKDAVQKNIWVYLSSYFIFMIVALCLTFSSSFTRKHPWNLIALSVVTLSLSYMVGTVASYHDTTAVVIAMGSTLVISFTIIIFSAQTRIDFTICNGILLILAVDLIMFGFFSCFFYSRVLQILYGSLGALVYALFLAVDTQLVMGRQKYSLDPEEYVFAALILYLDIMLIFLYILILLGGSSNK